MNRPKSHSFGWLAQRGAVVLTGAMIGIASALAWGTNASAADPASRLEVMAQEPGERVEASGVEDQRPHWRKNLFKRVLADQKFLVTTWAPSELRRPSIYFPLLSASAAAIGSAAQGGGLDVRLSSSISNWERARSRDVSRTVSRLGDAQTALALIGGTYMVSRWSGHTRLARASSLSAEALANTAIWSSALKRTARRARPSDSTKGEFLISDPAAEADSFPSGHAMGAFAVAAVFSGEYRDKRWVPWVAYGTAGLIATSRVSLGRHYLSDVVVGGVLGRSLGRMVVARERGIDETRGRLRFEPIFEPRARRYGVSYRHSW